jgi:amino acid transporter
VVKLVIIMFVVVCGWVALAGHMHIENHPHNFRNAFEGTTDSGYGIVMSLYNVIWSFIGYSNANYVSSFYIIWPLCRSLTSGRL